jgi:hypothetical protein
MASEDKKVEKIAAYATIIGLPVAILSVYLAYLQLRTPDPPAGKNPEYQDKTDEDNPNYLSGWTTTFEDNQVLQGRGGTLSLYSREVVPGFQVYVHIPKERVLKSERMKDGDGNGYLAVTVRPP